MNRRAIRANQARNQLGTPGAAKSFLRGAHIFKLCPLLLNYFQHIFPGWTKKIVGVLAPAHPGYCPGEKSWPRDLDTLCASAQFAPFACRGRLRNLLAECCTVGRYCVTINTAVKLQMFNSSYSSRRFAACDQGSHWVFFPPRSVFSRPVCLGYYECYLKW